MPPFPALSRRQLVRSVTGAAVAASSTRRSVAAAPRPTPDVVRAVYLNPVAITDDEFVSLVSLVEETELNAMVVDVKEDGIYVPTDVELFLDAGEVNPEILEVDGLLTTLRERDIYAIARIVTFRDSYLAEARPDLAVSDGASGGLWRSFDGMGWINPFKQETWQAYADFAGELASLGFDEIQWDYVRFPSDGDMSTLDFGLPVDETLRSDTIAAFLGFCSDSLGQTGVQTAADIFGYTLLLDDIGIGQNVGKLAGAVDYLCPMVYPSHFPNGSLDLPGHPNDFPADTIRLSLEAGVTRVGPERLRPWLQDFSLQGMTPYGDAEVRAQIDATEAAGANGWMLWAADSVYSRAALGPAG